MSVILTSTCNVLKLQDFFIQGRTFTLSGTTAQSIIVNVSRDFVMNGAAQVVLAGGLQWDNVLFNVLGTGNVVSFDQDVTIKSASVINGMVVGESIELASLSQIKNPAVVSQ
jgi:hypothetical protein